mmetsp:Transcript_27422/g.64269  ORF Transcript_27422/g.64269 Transcript_27422/m.64269 type:complete len:212 (-) Transcript_27422:191-826(-)
MDGCHPARQSRGAGLFVGNDPDKRGRVSMVVDDVVIVIVIVIVIAIAIAIAIGIAIRVIAIQIDGGIHQAAHNYQLEQRWPQEKEPCGLSGETGGSIGIGAEMEIRIEIRIGIGMTLQMRPRIRFGHLQAELVDSSSRVCVGASAIRRSGTGTGTGNGTGVSAAAAATAAATPGKVVDEWLLHGLCGFLFLLVVCFNQLFLSEQDLRSISR